MADNNEHVNGIDWRSVARSASKHSRKTIGFGDVDKSGRHASQFYIRELSISLGGLGCALWDASVILSRWLHSRRTILFGKTVLELGCGCGLPGIVSARYASKVWLTEYIPQLVKNVEYNIAVNSEYDNADDREALEKEAEIVAGVDGGTINGDLRPIATASFLDWFTAVPGSADTCNAGATPKCPPCTKHTQTARFTTQPWRHCRTCYPDDTTCGACVSCSAVCHEGHDLAPVETSRFRCDCNDATCKASGIEVHVADIPKVDIIIGAELTYNSLSVDALAGVINYYLKEDGVFYEVMAGGRDGMDLFIEKMALFGFAVEKHPVPEELMGAYNARERSHQRHEKYIFYTFRRPTSTFPIMQ